MDKNRTDNAHNFSILQIFSERKLESDNLIRLVVFTDSLSN